MTEPSRYYVLIGKLAVPEKNGILWASKFENIDKRRVAVTHIGNNMIVTLFTGIDLNYSGDGPPHIFETTVLRDGVEVDQQYCSSWQEAEAMHQLVVEEVRDEVLPFPPPRVVK